MTAVCVCLFPSASTCSRTKDGGSNGDGLGDACHEVDGDVGVGFTALQPDGTSLSAKAVCAAAS